MKIRIISIGTKMPKWVQNGFEEYQKRMPNHYAIQLIEIPLIKRPKNADLSHIIEEEAQKLLKAVTTDGYIIALDESGSLHNTEQVAKKLSDWDQKGKTINFLIGGPDGHAAKTLKTAHEIWSLSPLTFPHMLVRVILAEQLYRAWSLSQGHPYHRA